MKDWPSAWMSYVMLPVSLRMINIRICGSCFIYFLKYLSFFDFFINSEYQ